MCLFEISQVTNLRPKQCIYRLCIHNCHNSKFQLYSLRVLKCHKLVNTNLKYHIKINYNLCTNIVIIIFDPYKINIVVNILYNRTMCLCFPIIGIVYILLSLFYVPYPLSFLYLCHFYLRSTSPYKIYSPGVT
jgi:hypothetical protein